MSICYNTVDKGSDLMELLIAICDDDKEIHGFVEPFVERYFKEKRVAASIHKFYDGKLLLESPLTFDVIILDIEMYKVDGIKVKNELFKKQSKSKIIFLTDYEDYMHQAFGKNVYGFIKKTNIMELQTQLNIVTNEFLEHRMFKITGETMDTYDINYIEADDSYSIFHLENKGTITVRMTLHNVDEMLKEYGRFVRIHRSYVVNLRHVKYCRANYVKLDNGLELSVSRTKTREAREKFADYIREKITYGE